MVCISNKAIIPNWISWSISCWISWILLSLVKMKSSSVFLHSYFVTRIQHIQFTMFTRKFITIQPSPPEEDALGRGNRCVHLVPYPAVTSQTQGNHHLGRPVCFQKQSCKYFAKYWNLKENAYVTVQLQLIIGQQQMSHLLQFAGIVLSTLVDRQRGVDG